MSVGRVLVACECSGRVRDAFAALGWDAWSCDTQPSETEGNHIQGDALEQLERGWDMIIAHPPCTYLSTVGNKWFKTQPDRAQKRSEAMEFFMALYNAPIPHVCIENPQGFVNSNFRRPDQVIHPYYFGEPQLKRTCLWLRGLPRLVHCEADDFFLKRTHVPKPEPLHVGVDGRGKHWCEMLVRLPVSERARARSRTFKGVANAMAQQWTDHFLSKTNSLTGGGGNDFVGV